MKDITFVDLEVTLNTCRVVDIGAVRSDRTPFHEIPLIICCFFASGTLYWRA